MNTSPTSTSNRRAAVLGLAVVGFIGLVALGMWLAVYSTRYVPSVVNRVGSAAVYLGSVFNKGGATLSVVPTPIASSTISTIVTSVQPIQAPSTTPKTPIKPSTTTAGQKTSSTVQMGGGTSAPALSGFPDLIVIIKNVGYLATSSADSFVATSTVPVGGRPAVAFTIKNIGTNTTGVWRFSASIPTQTAYLYYSPSQQSLNPGESIDYTLGFDQANKGTDQMISISANFDHAITESNTNNNSASTKVTILN